jgi:hypothetical protein
MTVQPTEQCVQTFLRVASVAPGGLGLADGAERESAERSKAAGRETRAAQKAATINTCACLDREVGGKRGAAGFALGPFDQHVGLLHFAG